jgi:hypothetical protein
MKSPLLLAIRACALFCSPLAMSTAVGAPTLIFFEPTPLDRPTAVETAIDVCVNFVKAHQLEEASRPCDVALSAAQRDSAGTWTVAFTPRLFAEQIAVAYNNRAVLRLLSGQLERAAADASHAMKAAPLPGIASTAEAIRAKQRGVAAAP